MAHAHGHPPSSTVKVSFSPLTDMEILGRPRRGCSETVLLVPVVFGDKTLEEVALGAGGATFTNFMLPDILKGQKPGVGGVIGN